MEEYIYYKNVNQMVFEAQVLECILVEEGYGIRLNQTAFFPGGGGQPHDEGTLNEQKVLRIIEDNNEIYHVVEKAISVGQTVKGSINATRRVDFMQQHSGEHIISGIVNKLYGYNNVGFSLSEDKMTADFDGILSQEQVQQVECLANEAIYKNKLIRSEFYTKEALEEIAYRSKKAIEGKIRLVDIEGYDCCACCGVHVEYTGQIGLIKILSAQRHRGGTRLTILCGERALKDYQVKHQNIDKLAAYLSLRSYEIVEGVERLLEEKNQLKEQLITYKIKLFQEKMKHYDKKQPLFSLEAEVTPFELKLFANLWMKESDCPCLLLAEDHHTYKYVLGGNSEQIKKIANILHEQFKGKGGGKDIFQGTLQGTYENILNMYEKIWLEYK